MAVDSARGLSGAGLPQTPPFRHDANPMLPPLC